MIKTSKFYKMFDYLCVFMLIASSGVYYMQQLNMPITGVLLVVTGFFINYFYGNPLRSNCLKVMIMLGIVFSNIILTVHNGINYNGVIIVCMQLFFLLELTSNMSFEKFKHIFLNIMVFEAILSVCCFFWVDVFAISNLPLQKWEMAPTGPVNMTPYYIVGWTAGSFGRNSGWFGEPGAHQIFLNLALVYALMLDKNQRGKIFKIIILIVAVLTTQSTTGYMCLALALCSSVFSSGKYENSSKVLAIIGLTILYYVESSMDVISDKLSGGGSYRTRENDTVGGYRIALSAPIIGYGMYRTNTAEIYATEGIGTISNGLASMAIGFGIIVVLIYLISILFGMKKNIKSQFFSIALIFAMIVFCMNAEGGATLPIYMLWLFDWNHNSVGDISNENNMSEEFKQ